MSKTAILALDDDPQVLASVSRDLRQRYGKDHSIVRSSSGAEALDTLTRLKARGDKVAVLVADQRMPSMTGTEFLTRAKTIFPDAKTVLLTAYSDTAAAISAINDVQLDHYLLKPWDPPEEHLYPVLDEMIEEWTASNPAPYEGVMVFDTRWSPHRTCRQGFPRSQSDPVSLLRHRAGEGGARHRRVRRQQAAPGDPGRWHPTP
jgi:thioredoxin reductase (NADPH)